MRTGALLGAKASQPGRDNGWLLTKPVCKTNTPAASFPAVTGCRPLWHCRAARCIGLTLSGASSPVLMLSNLPLALMESRRYEWLEACAVGEERQASWWQRCGLQRRVHDSNMPMTGTQLSKMHTQLTRRAHADPSWQT